jgi:hypothetical protein
MGNLFREYWLPAMLSEELPAPDGDPLRVLMLGEQLTAFRDTKGPIYDRRQEHLGTSDAMVIRVRRRLIAAIKAHMQ